jgi:magnesium chelatase subunit I
MTRPQTLGELKASGYASRSVKDEIRQNLMRQLKSGAPLFSGIVGYEDTVIPQVINALLARQNFILLGLRGQAKSRILRDLTSLLDPEIPVLAGSEINDDPFTPLSAYGRQLLNEKGDDAPIAWVDRDARYVEKLATPDVTIADIIGDVDPIKAARGGHLLSDELTIHYGLLPRANRGIFAINELPDLAGKIQVGLFNILQEGDVQIKGYPIRLPLDVLLVFSANPEDYTARGKIITPLKDRIGAEIQTHYPATVTHGIEITRQEAWTERAATNDPEQAPISIPAIIREIVEQVAFIARDDKRIDKRSGVSQRLPISLLESVVSNAERRALLNNEVTVAPRISDIYASLPAITGKLELEYEGEQIGAERIARELIRKACQEVFIERYSGIDLRQVLDHFNHSKGGLVVHELASNATLLGQFQKVKGLLDAVRSGLLEDESDGTLICAAELVLEGLHAQKKLARSEERGSASYTQAAPERPSKRRDRDFEDWSGGRLN